MSVPKHWLLGGWYSRGLIIHQQRYRPSDSNTRIDIKFRIWSVLSIGIVRFEIKYEVFAPTLADQQIFTSTSNVLDQSGTIDVTWDDGNRLDITVKAYDILEKFAEDKIIVYKDTSPPLIENVWLSRGDRVNISVHSIEDFTKMTYVFSFC